MTRVRPLAMTIRHLHLGQLITTRQLVVHELPRARLALSLAHVAMTMRSSVLMGRPVRTMAVGPSSRFMHVSATQLKGDFLYRGASVRSLEM